MSGILILLFRSTINKVELAGLMQLLDKEHYVTELLSRLIGTYLN